MANMTYLIITPTLHSSNILNGSNKLNITKIYTACRLVILYRYIQDCHRALEVGTDWARRWCHAYHPSRVLVKILKKHNAYIKSEHRHVI